MSIFKVMYLSMMLVGASSLSQVQAFEHCWVGSKKCSLAIFPHSNYKQLLMTYKSVLEDLSLILDSRINLVSTRTMSDFAYKLDKKEYDLALIDSVQYVLHGQPAGYVPLASKNGELIMNLYVKSNSDIKSFDDLAGKKLGLTVLNTTTWFSVSILLKNNGIKKENVELVSLDSQQACAHAMAINQVDACVFSVGNLNIIKEQNTNIDFKSIGSSIAINFPVYAAHPKMSKELMGLVKSYLLSREGYIEVNDGDFDALRQLISELK